MCVHRLGVASCIFALLLAAEAAAPSARAAEADGRVTHVTLYRDQAQITRDIPVTGDAGPIELVVGNLPEQIVAGSLFAEGGDAIEIRAVRFRTRAVGDEPRERSAQARRRDRRGAAAA